MAIISEELQINPARASAEIEDLINSVLGKLHRNGAVIGLSGGLDSAVTAIMTIRSLGSDRVHVLNLPDRDSKKIHRQHARQLAVRLGVPLIERNITPILRASGSYKLLPLRYIPWNKLRAWLVEFGKKRFLADGEQNLLANRLQPEANSWMSRANAYVVAKHRIRMVILYQYAEVHNLMVVGAANRTEWLTGTFSQWGVDHCADLMPLIHLYRSQVEQLAEHIQIPDYIRTKPADPDFIPGLDDKGRLLGDFSTVDQILYGIENQIGVDELSKQFDSKTVKKIHALWELSQHMRESPYQIME